MRKLGILAGVALPLAIVTAPVLGASGGGGGGGEMPSVSTPSYDPAVEYRKGVDAFQANNFKDALKAFKNVLAVAPRDANTNYLAGLSSIGLDRKSVV